MAFGHTTGTAANMAAFFAALEAFLTARGWNVVAGAGTTDIVYVSTGEALGFTKLYIRVWQDGTTPHHINFRVQDDAAGTHNTQDATYGYISAVGGNGQFEYWISGDLDCIFITVKGNTGYSGAWMGVLVPYAIDQTDETHFMCSFNPEFTFGSPLQYINGRILQSHTGTWNQACYIDTTIYSPGLVNPLDGGITIPASKAYLTDQQVHGQPKFFGGPLRDMPAANPEDLFDSGEPASVREWLIFGEEETRWAMMRVGPQPPNTRGTTADYYTARGVANNWNDFFNIIAAAAGAAGWTIAVHPSGGWRYYSTGELGTENIYCWLTLTVNILYTRVQNDAAGTHYAGSQYNYPSFPYDVFCGADRDCILFTLDKGTGPLLHWMGRAMTTYLDETAVGDEYKLCAGHGESSFFCLRQPDGTWNRGISWVATNPGFRYRSYSPQTYDGVYIGHWPLCYWSTTSEILFGLKHLVYVYPFGAVLNNYDLFQMDNGDLAFYRLNNRGHRAA